MHHILQRARRATIAMTLSIAIAVPAPAFADDKETTAEKAAHSCITTGTGSMFLALLPGFLTFIVDGGVLLVTSLPAAAKIGAAGCVSGAVGTVIADKTLGK